MKKNRLGYRRAGAATIVIAAVVCGMGWLTPAFAKTEKDKTDKAPAPKVVTMQPNAPAADQTEEEVLVSQLINDGLINQFNGFLVEKKQNKLYIDGQEQAGNITSKYLSATKKAEIRVQVFSFSERQKQHTDAGFIQLLLPSTFSSPCVDYKAKEPGC